MTAKLHPGTSDREQGLAKEFRDYVYGVSHDVGAPVRAMVEFSRLLTDEHAQALNDEGRLYLALIIENGEKLQKMMGSLLDYSRLNTESRTFMRMSCNAALRASLVSLADKIAASGARIERDALPEIMGDEGQITYLFAALIDNALTFQPKGNVPLIKIFIENRGDRWAFAVADNGIGIDERYHNKIFQIFQRLHRDKDYPGIGMGLTLAQKIVHHHGGKIWVESDPNRGSTFFFTLPVNNF